MATKELPFLRTPNAVDKVKNTVKLGVMQTQFEVASEDRAPVGVEDVSAAEDLESKMHVKMKVDTGAEIT